MSEWMAIERWPECVKLARPGIVFEIQNAGRQSLFTPCVEPLPAMPLDWTSPPVRFRAVREGRPQHSPPLPAPKG
jgi:hypothetical protein